MATKNTNEREIPNFRNVAIIHGLVGILEYTLILINTFVYVSNILYLIICVSIASGFLFILEYAIIFKNPYYYIICWGFACLTFYPTTISMIMYFNFTKWSYEPIQIFIVAALIIETLYFFVFIRIIGYNKYISYFHDRYMPGWPIRKGSLLVPSHYSVKEFDKLNKGQQYWQDRDPEETQKWNEEMRAFDKRFKKKALFWFTFLAFFGFNIIFGISLL